MRIIRNSIPLTVLLVSFLGAEITYAYRDKDAFGLTNYGFKCENKIYQKYHIYAAAKKMCDAMKVRPEVKNEELRDARYRKPWKELANYGLFDFSFPPYYLAPILRNDELFPSEKPPHLRVYDPYKNRYIDAGTDRLIIDEKCDVIAAFIDYDYSKTEYGGKIVMCNILHSPEDSRAQENIRGRHRGRYRGGSHGNTWDHSPDGFRRKSNSHSPVRYSTGSHVSPPYHSPGHSPDQSPRRVSEQHHNQHGPIPLQVLNGPPSRSPSRSPIRSPAGSHGSPADQSTGHPPDQSPRRAPGASPDQSSRRPPEQLHNQFGLIPPQFLDDVSSR